MQERLRRYNVVRWADDFVQSLLSTQKTEAARRARLLTGKPLMDGPAVSLDESSRVAAGL
jgi:hypothetical protein